MYRYGCPIGLVLSLVLAAPASAQRAAGPNEGVLGTTENADARHTLTFRGSLFGAWDDMLTEDSSENSDAEVDRRFLREGLAGGLQGGLRHARRSRRTDWSSSVESALRLYGADDDAIAATLSGRTALTSNLNSRVGLALSGGWSYSPYYEIAPSYGTQAESVGSFGGGFNVATAAERNISTDGSAGITVRLSQRDTFEVSGDARHWNFLDQPDSTVTSYGARARYRHSLSRALGIYGGYGREQGLYQFSDAGDLTTDSFDAGVDYGETLEFTRRTALSFSFSTSAIRWEDDTHYRVNGSATLTRSFGRTGSGLLQYQRSVEPAGGFREPLLTDTFSGGVSDQIGRNASWSVNAGYVRGEVGFDDVSRRYDVFDAGGRVTRAVTRHLGIFGAYSYYRYDVPAETTVFTFLPKFSRQSLSMGLTVWAPLINDTRPPRDLP